MKRKTRLFLIFGTFLCALLLPTRTSAQQTITCESNDGGRKYCGDSNPGQVSLQRQLSNASCVEGRSWGVDSQGLWVDRGCRGIFSISQNYGGYGDSIACESNDGGRQYCGRANPRRISLQRQLSNASCVQGRSWGVDDQGLWVDRGCRAVFAVGKWHDRDRDDSEISGSIKCESNNGGRNYCGSVGRRNQVSLQRQISGSPCVQGESWGVDREGLWVDRGCRAVFVVGNNDGNYQPDYGGSVPDYPRVAVDTSGRGSFSSKNMGSSNVTRGWVDTRGERNSVSLTGPNDFKITFYGDVIQADDRRMILRINMTNRGRADGQVEVLLNGDRNEVQSITVTGNNFNGSFSR